MMDSRLQEDCADFDRILYGRKDRMDDRSRGAPSYSFERCLPFVLVPESGFRRGIEDIADAWLSPPVPHGPETMTA
jgi:hypothetical protein